MSRDSDGNAALVLVAFVMGAVTGAAVALLCAPATGEETRRVLNERAREGRDLAMNAAQKGRSMAADAAQRGRDFVREQREHLTEAIDRGKAAYARVSSDADASEEQS